MMASISKCSDSETDISVGTKLRRNPSNSQHMALKVQKNRGELDFHPVKPYFDEESRKNKVNVVSPRQTSLDRQSFALHRSLQHIQSCRDAIKRFSTDPKNTHMGSQDDGSKPFQNHPIYLDEQDPISRGLGEEGLTRIGSLHSREHPGVRILGRQKNYRRRKTERKHSPSHELDNQASPRQNVHSIQAERNHKIYDSPLQLDVYVQTDSTCDNKEYHGENGSYLKMSPNKQVEIDQNSFMAFQGTQQSKLPPSPKLREMESNLSYPSRLNQETQDLRESLAKSLNELDNCIEKIKSRCANGETQYTDLNFFGIGTKDKLPSYGIDRKHIEDFDEERHSKAHSSQVGHESPGTVSQSDHWFRPDKPLQDPYSERSISAAQNDFLAQVYDNNDGACSFSPRHSLDEDPIHMNQYHMHFQSNEEQEDPISVWHHGSIPRFSARSPIQEVLRKFIALRNAFESQIIPDLCESVPATNSRSPTHKKYPSMSYPLVDHNCDEPNDSTTQRTLVPSKFLPQILQKKSEYEDSIGDSIGDPQDGRFTDDNLEDEYISQIGEERLVAHGNESPKQNWEESLVAIRNGIARMQFPRPNRVFLDSSEFIIPRPTFSQVQSEAVPYISIAHPLQHGQTEKVHQIQNSMKKNRLSRPQTTIIRSPPRL